MYVHKIIWSIIQKITESKTQQNTEYLKYFLLSAVSLLSNLYAYKPIFQRMGLVCIGKDLKDWVSTLLLRQGTFH